MENSRRRFLKLSLATGMTTAQLLSGSEPVTGQEVHRHSKTIEYLLKLKRNDGGFGWDDQERSHLSPTHFAVGSLKLLGHAIESPSAIAQWTATHHPADLKKLEQEHRIFNYQQLQTLVWLGEDVTSFRTTIEQWKQPVEYLKQYEKHGWPVFMQEASAIVCRELVGLSADSTPDSYARYLARHRRPNGSFNNSVASDGSDGNILNTWWGLRALHVLGRTEELKDKTIEWLQGCQWREGGFTHQPNPKFAMVDDVAYTWAAVRALDLLGAAPRYQSACVEYLNSLRNEDGGYGDRTGWSSNPMATYYAIDALHTLSQLDASKSQPTPPKNNARTRSRLDRESDDRKVFTIQIEAHGQGSPKDAVRLARDLKIHLWGAKNCKPEWIARAQQVADEAKVPVRFVVANEEYGTWVDVPGMGTYSHTSDVIGPTIASLGTSLANEGVVTWEQFRQQRLSVLDAGECRLIWQFGENEPLVRLLLDDSLERGGFAAISTFHFGNPDFTNSEPFLKRYRNQLPFVALQDAHGPEPWWFADMTTGFRTLFVATEPTWEGWLNALKNNWVVSVRHDEVSGNATWMHGGSDAVLQFVQAHQDQWQWWSNSKIHRPLVSLVALTPDESFESGRPEEGVAIRVRCAWRNTTQGLAKQPLVELIRLEVNGQKVNTESVKRKRGNGAYEDVYDRYVFPKDTTGMQTVTAFVRELSTGNQSSETITVKF